MSYLPPVNVSNGVENTLLFNLLLQSDLGDNDFRLFGWNHIKANAPSGLLDIPKIMGEVEQEFLKEGKPLIDNVNQLFENFRKKLAPELQVIQFPEAEFQPTELRFNEIQNRLQHHYEYQALKSIVERLIPMIYQLKMQELMTQVANGEVQPDAAEAILVERMHACTHLLYTTTPPTIATVTPESIQAWFKNPDTVQLLQQFAELNIFNLDLKVLPTEICSMTGLQTLRLHDNQLTSLPEQINSLTNLQTLSLSQNKLTSLPEQICDLPALHSLYLSHNQLRSLPENFSSLSALRVLHITHNRLISFPEQLGKMPELAQISLVRNPLMFSFDQELSTAQNSTILHNRYQEFLNYPTQSYLGNLCKLIGSNQDPVDIQNAFEELDPALQQKIAEFASFILTPTSAASSSSDAAPIHEELFADIPLLARAVRGVTLEMFEVLSTEQRISVHRKIWEFAGSPETDNPSNWGEQHAFDNTLRLIDALEEFSKA